MIIPEFWAEGRVQHKEPGRQVTVRRFGWSDVSEEDAQAMADSRAQEALARILAGDKLARREFKDSYNGADGLPIREQILSRHGDTIITRNVYGAHCLNTPNVLFVDMDYDYSPRFTMGWWLPVLIVVTGAVFGYFSSSRLTFFIVIAGLFFLARGILRLMNALHIRHAGSHEARALALVEQFSARRPDWQLRVYATPAGLRVLALHALFAPESAEVAECFQELRADPVYVRMCLNQRCFRARISPKPWRMGISKHITPRPGVWPVKPQRLPGRQAWVAGYEAKAAGFASCRFLRTYGNGVTHPAAERVRLLHDERCRAHTRLPLA